MACGADKNNIHISEGHWYFRAVSARTITKKEGEETGGSGADKRTFSRLLATYRKASHRPTCSACGPGFRRYQCWSPRCGRRRCGAGGAAGGADGAADDRWWSSRRRSTSRSTSRSRSGCYIVARRSAGGESRRASLAAGPGSSLPEMVEKTRFCNIDGACRSLEIVQSRRCYICKNDHDSETR